MAKKVKVPKRIKTALPDKVHREMATYEPEMVDRILICMSEGMMIDEVAADLGITRKILDEWCDPDKTRHYHPDIEMAVKIGAQKAYAWLLKTGRENLANSQFNHSTWFSFLQHYHHWTKTVDVNHLEERHVKRIHLSIDPDAGKIGDNGKSKQIEVQADVFNDRFTLGDNTVIEEEDGEDT